MSVFLTALLVLCVFAALTDVVLMARRSTLSGTLAPAMAVFVALESILLNGLSFFNAVNRNWLLIFHIFFLVLWLSFAMYSGRMRPLTRRYGFLLRSIARNRHVQILFPLLILVGMASLLYPPNTYDVLTYHMARVVHWMQNNSISYYPTPIERQNVMGPGAEYLLLLLQSLSQSDYLANFLQFGSFIILIISSFHILRVFRIRGIMAGCIVILTVTTPIVIMEASNPKNDLVAAVMMLAVVFSSMRILLGDIRKMSLAEYALLGITLAGAFLVKPTALLAALPVIFIGACNQFPKLFSKAAIKHFFKGVILVLLMVIIFAGPDILRKQEGYVPRHEVYPLLHEYSIDRLWNPLRTFAHNTPFPQQTRALAHSLGYRGNLITKDVFNPHEDMVGNPYQAMALVATTFLSLFFWAIFFWRKPGNHYFMMLSISPVLAWFVFGLIVKDQAWITRLEIPLFFLLPFSFVYLSRIFDRYNVLNVIWQIVVCLSAFLSLAYASLIATHVPPRLLVLSHFWGEKPGRTGAYYTRISSLREDHDFFLQQLRDSGCRRVGVISGPDSVDYPLSWRVMQEDKETRFLREQVAENGRYIWRFRDEDADWPCIMYATLGVPEHVPDRGRQYISAGDYHTYLRNLPWEFDQSEMNCFLINGRDDERKIVPLHEVTVEYRGQGIYLTSLGNDAQVLLPRVSACGNARSAVMQLTIESPVDTVVQLFYKTKMSSAGYSEQNSIVKKCSKGYNRLYFFLPLDDIVGAIRMDPGRQPGTYLIKNLEIRPILKR